LSKKKDEVPLWVILLFSVPLMAGGVGLLCLSWNHYCEVRETAGWTRTDGTVVSSSLETKQSGSGTSSSTTHWVHVRYSYVSGGRKYEGDRYSPVTESFNSGSMKSAREFLSEHAQGQAVDVYYDPGAPQNACLLAGMKGDTKTRIVLLTVGGIAFFGFGSLLLVGCIVDKLRG